MEDIKFVDISNMKWDGYIEKMEGSTFNYTADKINFDVEYAENIIANESRIFLVDNQPVAASVVYVEENSKKKNTISWAGNYCMAPLISREYSYKMQEKYMEKILFYIEELAKKYNCKEILLKYDPLVNASQDKRIYNYNCLLKQKYFDRSSLTQIIDLRQEEKQLFSEIRKGHKSDIKKGNYTIEFFDKENITEAIINEYRRIYECDAGKVTRNSEMAHHYLKFVQDGYGIVGIAKKNEENVAVIIVTFYKNTAYYSSYAELTEQLNGIPVGHMLQWNTILLLKQRGIQFYEMGEQVFGKTHYNNPDRKLINISNFKRGFGGYTVPFFRGIKMLEG